MKAYSKWERVYPEIEVNGLKKNKKKPTQIYRKHLTLYFFSPALAVFTRSLNANYV